MQGQLGKESLEVAYETECAHCGEPMHMGIGSDMSFRIEEDTEPLAFLPMVDFKRLKDPSIIDAF